MFGSLLRPRKDGRSETTPLLAALTKYRSRHTADEHSASERDDYHEDVAQYDGEDEDDEDDARRDGPLLPVFSSEVLGARRV